MIHNRAKSNGAAVSCYAIHPSIVASERMWYGFRHVDTVDGGDHYQPVTNFRKSSDGPLPASDAPGVTTSDSCPRNAHFIDGCRRTFRLSPLTVCPMPLPEAALTCAGRCWHRREQIVSRLLLRDLVAAYAGGIHGDACLTGALPSKCIPVQPPLRLCLRAPNFWKNASSGLLCCV